MLGIIVARRQIVPTTVAVNLSAAQFKLHPTDRVITENLAKYHVGRPAELELTESVLMETTSKHSEATDGCAGSGAAGHR